MATVRLPHGGCLPAGFPTFPLPVVPGPPPAGRVRVIGMGLAKNERGCKIGEVFYIGETPCKMMNIIH